MIDALYITHILASVANLLNLNPEINIPGTNLAETVVVKNDFFMHILILHYFKRMVWIITGEKDLPIGILC